MDIAWSGIDRPPLKKIVITWSLNPDVNDNIGWVYNIIT